MRSKVLARADRLVETMMRPRYARGLDRFTGRASGRRLRDEGLAMVGVSREISGGTEAAFAKILDDFADEAGEVLKLAATRAAEIVAAEMRRRLARHDSIANKPGRELWTGRILRWHSRRPQLKDDIQVEVQTYKDRVVVSAGPGQRTFFIGWWLEFGAVAFYWGRAGSDTAGESERAPTPWMRPAIEATRPQQERAIRKTLSEFVR